MNGPVSRPRAPVWLMGLANLPFGMSGAVALITVPQLLEARDIAQPVIADITATALVPTFTGFLLAPILDVRFSRRAYSLLFALLTAALCVAALLDTRDLGLLGILLTASMLAAQLFYCAVGGWLGSVVPSGSEGRLAAWFTIANIAGYGIAAIVGVTALRALPAPYGASLVGLLIVAPVALFPFVPASDTDRRGARESFATMFGDLGALIRDGAILRTLLLFSLPAASFALTNQLGGLGDVYHASEGFVATVAGIGVTLAGVAGSLAMPPILRRAQPWVAYVLVGAIGALFTLSLMLLPHTPAAFAVAIIGQNVFQSAAFTTESTIIFRGIGAGNPLAATQFAFLQAATAFPITYMQAVDGKAYAAGGIVGTYAVDAGLSLATCLLLLPLVRRWRRTLGPDQRVGTGSAPE